METAAGSAVITGATASQGKKDWLHVNYAGLVVGIMLGLAFISAGLTRGMQGAVSALMSQPFETDSWLNIYKGINYLLQHPSEISIYYVAYIIGEPVEDLLLFFGIWRLFRKAGLRGWEMLIPLYNIYCLFEVAGITGLWLAGCTFIGALLECGMMSGFLRGIYYYGSQNVAYDAANIQGIFIVIIPFAICFLIVYIAALHRLASRFGHGGWFTVGLIFLNTLFFLILCWDDHQASNMDYSEDSANRKAAVALIAISVAIMMIVSAAMAGSLLALLGQGNVFNVFDLFRSMLSQIF